MQAMAALCATCPTVPTVAHWGALTSVGVTPGGVGHHAVAARGPGEPARGGPRGEHPPGDAVGSSLIAGPLGGGRLGTAACACSVHP